MEIRTGRVYDPLTPDEPLRVLVDRLWPRGMHRDDPRAGRWHPDVAPSTNLRRWYGHQTQRREEFIARYLLELEDPAHTAALAGLAELAATGPLLLVTATREVAQSHLPTLARVLRAMD